MSDLTVTETIEIEKAKEFLVSEAARLNDAIIKFNEVALTIEGAEVIVAFMMSPDEKEEFYAHNLEMMEERETENESSNGDTDSSSDDSVHSIIEED